MAKDKRAPDIQELQKHYEDAENDEFLSNAAIIILDRLWKELTDAHNKKDQTRYDRLLKDIADLQKVVLKIRGRHNNNPLDKFDAHTRKIHGQDVVDYFQGKPVKK